MTPASVQLSEFNQTKEENYDDVITASGMQSVSMTVNPAYGNNSSIKMDENPAYRCLEE